MKFIPKKKGGAGEVKIPNALIMSLFEDEDVKKAIRASVSVVKVIETVSPAKEMVTQALNMPYVAQKRQEKEWGLSTASSHHVTRTAWLSARSQFGLEFSRS
eukprot:4775403-Ditylum_brightwellii.AAC.1